MTPKHKKTKILATIPLRIKNKQPSVCVSAGPRWLLPGGRRAGSPGCPPSDSPDPRGAGELGAGPGAPRGEEPCVTTLTQRPPLSGPPGLAPPGLRSPAVTCRFLLLSCLGHWTIRPAGELRQVGGELFFRPPVWRASPEHPRQALQPRRSGCNLRQPPASFSVQKLQFGRRNWLRGWRRLGFSH